MHQNILLQKLKSPPHWFIIRNNLTGNRIAEEVDGTQHFSTPSWCPTRFTNLGASGFLHEAEILTPACSFFSVERCFAVKIQKC